MDRQDAGRYQDLWPGPCVQGWVFPPCSQIAFGNTIGNEAVLRIRNDGVQLRPQARPKVEYGNEQWF